MSVASRAQHLCALHEKGIVSPRDDVVGSNRLPKARPPGPRIILGIGAEQRRAAADASIESLRVQFVIGVCEGPLSAGLAGNLILLGRQLFFPFSCALDDLAEWGDAGRRTG